MHIKFQNAKHWELLNRTYAKLKGFTLFEGKPEPENQPKGPDPDTVETPDFQPEPLTIFG